MGYLLATNVDGEYWKSALEILLYPTGCSFYRQFSYRRDLCAVGISPTQDGESSETGVIGFRFRDDAGQGTRHLFIPLRQIDEIRIRDRGEYHVDFRLGRYFCHEGEEGFRSFDLSVEFGGTYQAEREILFAKLPGAFENKLAGQPVSESLPSEIWEKLIKDKNMSKAAATVITDTVVMQLIRVRQQGRKSELAPAEIGESTGRRARRFGYRLEATRVYDLELVHRTLRPGGIRTHFRATGFECVANKSRVRTSQDTVRPTGNYREVLIWVQPRTVEPAACLLTWEPREDSHNASSADTELKAIPLSIPYAVTHVAWYRFKIGRLIVGAAFSVAAATSFCLAGVAIRDGVPAWSVILGTLGGLLMPIGVNALSRWWDAREELEN